MARQVVRCCMRALTRYNAARVMALFLTAAACCLLVILAGWLPQGSQETGVGQSEGRQPSRATAEEITSFSRLCFGIMSAESCTTSASNMELLATLRRIAQDEGLRIVSRPWSEAHDEILGGKLVPVLLEAGDPSMALPPRVFLGRFSFEGVSFFALISNSAQLFTLTESEFNGIPWRTAHWVESRSPVWRGIVHVGASRIRVSDFSVFLGQVRPHDRVKARFTVRNDSASPVRIVDVRTTCGCTTADVGRRVLIQPRQEIPFDVSVDTGANRPIAETALLTLSLDPNADKGTVVPFHVFAWQPNAMQVTPTQVDFGLVAAPQPAEFVLHVAETPFDQFDIQSVDTSGLPIDVKVTTTGTTGNRDHLVRLNFNGVGFTPGRYERSIRLKTTSRWTPSLEVPVRFSVASNVAVRPEMVTFGIVPLGADVAPHVVDFDHARTRILSIMLLRCPTGFQFDEIHGQKPQLRVRLATDFPGSKIGIAQVFVRWDDGDEIVSISCHGIVRESKL